MPLVDVIIILLLGAGAVNGIRRGFFKQTISTIGIILVIVLAFILKNPVSIFLYSKLPFFNFDGIFAGVSSLNILVYELIAFLIVGALLMIIFRILVRLAGFLESLLNFTIFLGIPSKILGAVVGLIESYIWIFIALYILTLPFFNIELVNQSRFKTKILNNMPLIYKYVENTVGVVDEIYDLKQEFKDEVDSNELNRRVIDVMLKHKMVTVKGIDKLVDQGKLKILGIDTVLNKYR